jgi:Aspartyl protease/PDZ domain
MKRRSALRTLSALAILVAATVCTADRGSELLELHLNWRGGRANLESLRDISATGTLSVAGLEGPLTVVQQGDGYRKVEYDLKVVSGKEFVTPKGGWEVNESGQLDAMDVVKLESQRRNIDSAFERHLLAGEVAYVGEEEHDGRSWEVLRFDDAEGDHADLLIDPGDGSLSWARTVAGGQISWEHMEDWRLVEGVRMAYLNTSQPPGGAPATTVIWDEVRINQGLTPADFDARKAGRQVVHLGDDDAWIPFTLYEERYIYMPCIVNGVETELLLDSGAGITVLDKSFADAIGLKGEGEITARGTSGTQAASLASGVNITLGDVELKDLTVAIIDLGDLTRRFGRSMPVIMGKELFNNAIVDIDYPRQRVAFHDAANYGYEETGHSLQMHPTHNGKRLVELSIEDQPPAMFQVDTGSGACVDIFDAYTRERGLLDGREGVSTTYRGGVGGVVESKVATLASLEFAGYRLANVPAGFAPPGEGGFGTTDFAGNLGAGIFTRFRLIFDFTRNRLHVESGPEWDTQPFKRNRLGVATDYVDGQVQVMHVAQGSPAEKAGIKAGDAIATVNGEPLTEATRTITIREVSRAPAGTTVTLKLGDGRELRIELAEYY